MPVPDVFFTVTASAKPLLIKYSFSIWQPEPRIKFLAPPEVPVRFKRRLRAA